MGLVRGCPGGERHEHRYEQVRHVVVQLVHDVQCFTRARVTDAQHVLVVEQELIDDVRVPHGVGGWDDDGRESLVGVWLVLRYRRHPLHPLALVLVVAVLVHARVALALGGHERGEIVSFGFFA